MLIIFPGPQIREPACESAFLWFGLPGRLLTEGKRSVRFFWAWDMFFGASFPILWILTPYRADRPGSLFKIASKESLHDSPPNLLQCSCFSLFIPCFFPLQGMPSFYNHFWVRLGTSILVVSGSFPCISTIRTRERLSGPVRDTPHIAQYPFEIVSQRGVSHPFALFS